MPTNLVLGHSSSRAVFRRLWPFDLHRKIGRRMSHPSAVATAFAYRRESSIYGDAWIVCSRLNDAQYTQYWQVSHWAGIGRITEKRFGSRIRKWSGLGIKKWSELWIMKLSGLQIKNWSGLQIKNNPDYRLKKFRLWIKMIWTVDKMIWITNKKRYGSPIKNWYGLRIKLYGLRI